MQRADVGISRMSTTIATRLPDQTTEEYSSPLRQNELPPSPTNSSDTPVFVSTTPPSDTPPSSSMGDSWIAVTPSSDDEQQRLPQRFLNSIMAPDLALAVEGLRIHEHEESFPSEGEDDDDDDMSIPPSEDSSLEDEGNEDLDESSDDEETILAPRTTASLGQPISDEALRASLSTLFKSKDACTIDELPSPRRTTTQGPLGMESLSLVSPEDFATRTSLSTSRASSSKSHSRLGKKHSKRRPRSPSKSRNKDNQAQVYALWTAAITAGFLVGFGAGYAWKEYLGGGRGGEEIRKVGCSWCGDGKR